MKAESTMSTWAGFDASKETFDAALYFPVERGEAAREIMSLPKASFSRSPEGVKNFHHWSFLVREKAGLEGSRMRIVMEATGRYSKELAGWLREEIPFTEPSVEDPKTVSNFIKSLKVRNNTDPIAASALARYGAGGLKPLRSFRKTIGISVNLPGRGRLSATS